MRCHWSRPNLPFISHCPPILPRATAGHLRRLLSEREDRLRSKDREIAEMRNRLERLTGELGNTHNKVALWFLPFVWATRVRQYAQMC